MAQEWRERVPPGPYDAVVVGSGPNGLGAAVALARAGRRVLLLEQAATIGGGLRTEELTLPGFLHDVCSAIHPLGAFSPFLRSLPLCDHGLEWVEPEFALAHPFDDGTASVLERSVEGTARRLGKDREAYRSLFEPLARGFDRLAPEILGPLRIPRHPLPLALFGMKALRSARGFGEARFETQAARALFAGVAAHSVQPLERAGTAAAGLVLSTLAHVVGWPLPRGGSRRIAEALASLLTEAGGQIVTGAKVTSLEELPEARAVLLDITPRQLLRIAAERLPRSYRRALQSYRYGPGAFKVDLALDGPLPWISTECRRAGSLHLGGSILEIARNESAVWRGEHPERPFVLLAQQSVFDSSRAPSGKHTVWAYCHVPHGSPVDMTERILGQIERFAPGFRDLILGTSSRGPAALELHNPNLVGGDIGGGVLDLPQLFTRPVVSLSPYRTPARGLYLCSSSTPPGGGVHGLCGYHAARAVLKDLASA